MEYNLKKWEPADAPSVAKYANDPEIARWLRNVFPHPYTLADAEWYVNDCAQNSEERQWVRAIVVNGEAVGSIGVFLQNDVSCKNAELGYWLGRPFWGRGIMTAAVRELCGAVFAQYDVARIYAEPFADNAGSRRVLEKAGFSLEGTLRRNVFKNGEFHDSCVYALLRPEAL